MIDRDKWLPADGLTLEPNAERAAKEVENCLALTAGPGAGKSEMLAQRADFLLRTGSCPYPKRILAISFKVDASKNLKDRVKKRCGNDLGSRFDSYTFHAFSKRIIDRFRPVLVGNDALDSDYTIGTPRILRKQIDFMDLVPLASKILNDSIVARNAIRRTYSDVFLDEFQDCTNTQYELLKLAFQNTSIRLVAVGDTKQKIMGWAGALDGIFITFSLDFRSVPLNMYRNFRSKPQLLRVQNEIIKILDPTSVMPEEQMSGDEGEISSVGFDNCQQEAEFVAQKIYGWVHNDNVPLSEIAILISKQLDLYAAPIMNALDGLGIPYRNEQQLQDITTEPAARLIVDYLLCIYGAQEPAAWSRLMNMLIPFTEDEDGYDAFHQNWLRFIEQEKKIVLAQEFDSSKFMDFVNRLLNKLDVSVLTALSHDYEDGTRLNEVLNETYKKISSLLQQEPDLLRVLWGFEDDKSVRILTIHKSKGLEFHSVIMMAIEREIFFGDIDSNRCAFFVGVSRAKDRLMLTHVNQRQRPDGHAGRWDINRNPQTEFLGYAAPFISL